jgi:adenosylcobinamide kinase/adenosylcobinamide-phosphate guanylyltransferase
VRVHLLGTGSADGWPNPFCTCASCADARHTGQVRGQTGALVDDVVLIDCGPEIPAAASRAGIDLTGVRTLLFTHAHPDHVGPALLLFRHWARRVEPLAVYAPERVVDELRQWVAPSDPVVFHVVTAGDTFAFDGYTVHTLPAAHGDATTGEAVLFDLTAPDGRRLLYATDTGPLPDDVVDALRGTSLDLVLLEETFGDHLTHQTRHLDLTTFPDQLRRLRGAGALVDATDVVAVHLSHHNPPTAQLERRLAAWGARVVPDGTLIDVAATTTPRPAPPHRTLVIGGARSGKSWHAEQLVAAWSSVTYVATGPADDGDPVWSARIESHRRRRPGHWTTRETTDVAGVLASAQPGEVVLVDCLTLWLTRVMDDAGAWDGDLTLVDKQVDQLLDAWRATSATVVAVSNEVGQGIVPPTASGRLFRDAQGRLNARLAREADEVVMMVAGRPVRL